MNLLKTHKQHRTTILMGTFYLVMLQSSTLMAASSEPFPKSEDPIPAAVSTAVFGEATLPTMGQSAVVPSAPAEEPAEIAGASTRTGPSDGISELSYHDSDNGLIRGLVAQALSDGLGRDPATIMNITALRTQIISEDAAAEQAEVAARRARLEAAIIARAPAIAVRHVDLYQRLMAGRLEYRRDPSSVAADVILNFRDLFATRAGWENPFSEPLTFDLSRCGDAGQYLSINIGYKKAKIPANEHKVEVWICPKFLVERELSTTASYLAPIMEQWGDPVGYFWTWGGYDVKSDNYDYLLNGSAMDNDKNINTKWISGYRCSPHHPHTYAPPSTAYFLSHIGPHSYHPNFHVKL